MENGSSSSGDYFKVDGNTGSMIATGAVLDELIVNKSLLVQKPSDSATTALVTINGTTKITGNTSIGTGNPDSRYDLTMSGNMSISGYIYFGTETEYIYASGGNLHVHGSWFYVDTDYIKLGTGSTGVGINGNPPSAGGLMVYGVTYVKSPEEFYLDNSGTTNLPQYIEQNATAKYATALAKSTGVLGAFTEYNIGGDEEPVYFSGGIPTKCSSTFITSDNFSDYLANYISDYLTWSNISGKPDRFPATSHDHSGTGHSHTISSGASSTGITHLYLSGP